MTGQPAPRRQPEAPLAGGSMLFTALEGFQGFNDILEGEVAQLRGNGFTDDQARAILAASFGWRPKPADDAGENE